MSTDYIELTILDKLITDLPTLTFAENSNTIFESADVGYDLDDIQDGHVSINFLGGSNTPLTTGEDQYSMEFGILYPASVEQGASKRKLSVDRSLKILQVIRAYTQQIPTNFRVADNRIMSTNIANIINGYGNSASGISYWTDITLNITASINV